MLAAIKACCCSIVVCANFAEYFLHIKWHTCSIFYLNGLSLEETPLSGNKIWVSTWMNLFVFYASAKKMKAKANRNQLFLKQSSHDFDKIKHNQDKVLEKEKSHNSSLFIFYYPFKKAVPDFLFLFYEKNKNQASVLLAT